MAKGDASSSAAANPGGVGYTPPFQNSMNGTPGQMTGTASVGPSSTGMQNMMGSVGSSMNGMNVPPNVMQQGANTAQAFHNNFLGPNMPQMMNSGPSNFGNLLAMIMAGMRGGMTPNTQGGQQPMAQNTPSERPKPKAV